MPKSESLHCDFRKMLGLNSLLQKSVLNQTLVEYVPLSCLYHKQDPRPVIEIRYSTIKGTKLYVRWRIISSMRAFKAFCHSRDGLIARQVLELEDGRAIEVLCRLYQVPQGLSASRAHLKPRNEYLCNFETLSDRAPKEDEMVLNSTCFKEAGPSFSGACRR